MILAATIFLFTAIFPRGAVMSPIYYRLEYVGADRILKGAHDVSRNCARKPGWRWHPAWRYFRCRGSSLPRASHWSPENAFISNGISPTSTIGLSRDWDVDVVLAQNIPHVRL
jgi:hypothetical protein